MLLLQLPLNLPGQVLVDRCKLLDQSSPINNIWVDEDNIKWVANTQGLNKVFSLDLVEKVPIPAGTTSLLTIRGGNAKLEWSTSEMQQLVGNVIFTCASYDPKTKTVWLGTKESGAFQITVSPLRVVQRLNTDNKKLASNQINDIFVTTTGTTYIATNDGMLIGSGDKWTLQERYLNFVGVDAWGTNLWILGDDFLWQVDAKGKWSPIAIELKNVEGPLRDIAVDDEGRVWIASNMMTGYDVAADKYQRFGPGQYFTSQFVNCLDVDKDGSIWTGTKDKGLYLIQWESSLIISIENDNPLDCRSNEPTASLTTKVAGGQPPYTYKWNTGQTTPDISKLPKGEYVLTVTDAKAAVKTGKYQILDPYIKATVTQLAPSSGQADGSATVSSSGGSGQYIYQWDNDEPNITAIKLSAGLHTVTVSDKSGCSTTATITISEILTPLSASIIIVSDNKCDYSTNGSLKAEIKGGKSPFLYNWSTNAGSVNTLTSLAPGNYKLTVTDASGQTSTASVVLNSPPAFSASIELLFPATVNASNGQAQVKTTGGKSPFIYAWNNGEKISIVKNLSTGPHNVTVTDANGCTAETSLFVSETITPINVSISQQSQISCHSTATASLNAFANGGKPPLKYLWSNGQTTTTVNGLMAGTYLLTVTDAAATTSTASFTISEPDPISVVVTADAIASSGGIDGKATAKVTGGTAPYQYNWDNGEKSNKALKLAAGNHIVSISDAMGCTSSGVVDISENILAMEVSIVQKSKILCAGSLQANVEATVKGGKAPFAYKWNAASTSASLPNIGQGIYTLTVTDATGHTATSVITVDSPQPLKLEVKVDAPASTGGTDGKATSTVSGGTGKYTYAWDDNEKTARAEKLSAGTHRLTVTDENGCTIATDVVITENILPLVVKINQDKKINCNGHQDASLSADVSGGKQPYTYTWSGAGKEFKTESLKEVAAGMYTLNITDATGAKISKQYEITEPKLLKVTADDIKPASTGNEDGEATINVTGGTVPYVAMSISSIAGGTSFKADKLGPGLHQVVVSDAAGCTAEVTFSVTETIMPLTVTIKQTNPIRCYYDKDAILEASAKGGKPPYTYTWTNGQSGPSISNLGAGNYSVAIVDATGQKATIAYELKAPPAMTVEIANLRSATNDRLNDGKGEIVVKNGVSPFKYSWGSGETTEKAVKLPVGTGKVLVTDANGCTANGDYTVNAKVLPELTAARLNSGEPIRMEKIQFAADSVKLDTAAMPSLDELYDFLYDNPTIIIEVSGHTNGLPADEYCDRISSERAKSVADYLISKGIEARRVISKGYGKRKPIASNQTPEGRKRNQRVEIRLIKIGE